MSHVMSYVTCKSPSCTGDTAACILVVDRICSLSMVIASAVQIGLNCCRRQECPRHLLTMFFDRRLEILSTTLLLARCIGTVSTPVCQYCQRRQEIWRYPGPVARPDLQCHYCCNASDVYEYHGQRQQLPQSTTRHVGPAVPARSWPQDYLQTYLLLAISRTRQSAH